jgi:hypothetical protein
MTDTIEPTADADNIDHPLTVAVEHGCIAITGQWVEHIDEDGHDCRCGDIHEPGPDFTGPDADVIWLDPVAAVELASEILRLAVPLLDGSENA